MLPRLCVSSDGAVDSIQLVSSIAPEHLRRIARDARERHHRGAGEGALSAGRAGAARRARAGEAPDRRRGAAQRLRGSDASLRPRPASGASAPGCRWCSPSGPTGAAASPGSAELEEALLSSVRAARSEPERLAQRGERALRLSGRLPRPLLREAALQLRPARARGTARLLRAGLLGRERWSECPSWRRARSANERAERRPRGVAEILERTLAGERLSDADALTLLRSRELIAVGRAANEIRNRKTDPGRVTFVVDRNINYTNICSVRCEFCAFSSDPGDLRGGYLLPKPVLFKKIEETLALGGTGVLLQGGHHPDLDFAYYDDLFRSIKARYEIHLHALSPSEILHISRRSKLTVAETIRRLHEAGLDSIPGGGAEILVDRVRRSLSPRKAKTEEWLVGDARGAAAGPLDHGDDDVRPHRDPGRARRAHAPHPRAAGRDGGLSRLHLLDLPARRQPPAGQGRRGDRARPRSTTCSPRPSAASTSTTFPTSRPAG